MKPDFNWVIAVFYLGHIGSFWVHSPQTPTYVKIYKVCIYVIV